MANEPLMKSFKQDVALLQCKRIFMQTMYKWIPSFLLPLLNILAN